MNFTRNISRFIGVAIILLFSVTLCAQEFNKTDAQGRKQGAWKKYHEGTSALFYEGNFINDLPSGVFKYYYIEGNLKATMAYSQNGKVAHSISYHRNGKKLAEGKYIDQMKDSTWSYWSSSGELKSVEIIKNGLKEGKEISFFKDGSVAEELNWKNGLKHGKWIQYYENGKKRLDIDFDEGHFANETSYYYPNGKLEIKGKYVDGFRQGSWYFYNDDGSIHYQALYSGGRVTKTKRENGTFTEYYNSEMPASEFTYVKGKKHGPFSVWFDNGEWKLVARKHELSGETVQEQVLEGHTLQTKGQYKNGELDGVITHYSENGNVIKTEKYKEGVLIE